MGQIDLKTTVSAMGPDAFAVQKNLTKLQKEVASLKGTTVKVNSFGQRLKRLINRIFLSFQMGSFLFSTNAILRDVDRRINNVVLLIGYNNLLTPVKERIEKVTEFLNLKEERAFKDFEERGLFKQELFEIAEQWRSAFNERSELSTLELTSQIGEKITNTLSLCDKISQKFETEIEEARKEKKLVTRYEKSTSKEQRFPYKKYIMQPKKLDELAKGILKTIKAKLPKEN